MKHYKLPERIACDLYDCGHDESKMTEQDCVNEVDYALSVVKSWERDGEAKEFFGESYGQYRRQLTSYLTRQRKRGITPNGDYSYLDDSTKQLN